MQREKKTPKVKETGNRKLTVFHFQNIRAIRAQSKKKRENSIHEFSLQNFGGPKWRNQEIPFTTFHLKILEAQSEGTRNSLIFTSKFRRPKWSEQETSFIHFGLKNLDAKSEGNGKFNSLAVPTLDFCRPKVQETGSSIH